MSVESEKEASWRSDVNRIRAVHPRHILFLCVANSARSQVAEGLARTFAPNEVKISSAGSNPSSINPMATQVLGEMNIDTKDQRSKGIDAIDVKSVDVVITLCADEVCPVFPGNPLKVHWPLPDPAGHGIDQFRQVRDELAKRLRFLFGVS